MADLSTLSDDELLAQHAALEGTLRYMAVEGAELPPDARDQLAAVKVELAARGLSPEGDPLGVRAAAPSTKP